MSDSQRIAHIEVCLPTRALAADLEFFQRDLGFRLDTIFPADDPAVATLSAHGLHIRLDRHVDVAPGVLRVLSHDPDRVASGRRELTSPGGVRVHIVDATPQMTIPPTEHAFVVRRLKDNTPWIIGRAGMAYRDLIPGRLGGSIIASHIRIPDAGPVPDMVHYHLVGFQLIYCYSGWVRLVYEDQGPPFILAAGDCVIQPPQIRHRVLEASENLQVIEIGVPAEHITAVDHEMTLPNDVVNPDHDFSGQRFCRSELKDAVWTPSAFGGFEERETGIGAATNGVASVQVLRATATSESYELTHRVDIYFAFVLSGMATLNGGVHGSHRLSEGDAYVVPPHERVTLEHASADLQLLVVSLPAA